MIAGRTVVVNSDESETGDGYQCDNCGKVFAYRYYRDKHMKYNHRGTIRHDTRCYFNVRSKADISQLNLPHGTDN